MVNWNLAAFQKTATVTMTSSRAISKSLRLFRSTPMASDIPLPERASASLSATLFDRHFHQTTSSSPRGSASRFFRCFPRCYATYHYSFVGLSVSNLPRERTTPCFTGLADIAIAQSHCYLTTHSTTRTTCSVEQGQRGVDVHQADTDGMPRLHLPDPMAIARSVPATVSRGLQRSARRKWYIAPS